MASSLEFPKLIIVKLRLMNFGYVPLLDDFYM